MAKKVVTAILAVCMLGSLTACNGEEVKEVQVEIVQEVDEIAYATAPVEYGEVVSEVKLNCKYEPTEHEDLSFPVSYKIVLDCYVEEGDVVSKGDVLAELVLLDVENQVEETEYQLASLELKLEQTRELKEFDIESAKTLYEYTSKTKQDQEALQEKLEAIEDQYKTTLEDLEDDILITEMRLEDYRQQIRDGKLIAGMDGEITYLDSGLASIDYNTVYTEEDKKMITISSKESCYFIVEDTTYAEYIEEGDSLFVSYIMSGVKSQCEVTPAKMDEWEGRMYFAVVGEETFENEMRADMVLELDRKDNVLCVPTDAVHDSEEGTFVYIEENGLLSMRYVTVGLRGLDVTEITEGLSEGEIVVLK